jgi:hypothetical protein
MKAIISSVFARGYWNALIGAKEDSIHSGGELAVRVQSIWNAECDQIGSACIGR